MPRCPARLGAGTPSPSSAPPGTSLPSTYTDYEIANAFGDTGDHGTITRSKGHGQFDHKQS